MAYIKPYYVYVHVLAYVSGLSCFKQFYNNPNMSSRLCQIYFDLTTAKTLAEAGAPELALTFRLCPE